MDLTQLIITDIKAVEVRDVPFSVGLIPPWNPSQRITTRDYVVVRVETNAGLFGISMDGDYTPGLPARAKDIDGLVAAYFVGKPVMDMAAHTAFLHSVRDRGRFFFIAVALWDIVGKAVGAPLTRLWGGTRDKVLVYASTVQHGRSPEARAEDCRRYLAQGYHAVKLRLSAETVAGDIALVQAVRDAVGDKMEIMVDANQAGKGPDASAPGVHWDLARAEETARLLGGLGVFYLEEPLPYVLEDDGVRLRERSPIPIAGGEGKLGPEAFWQLLRRGVYDIIQPDPIVSGTPTDMLKIRAMAEAAGVQVIYHHRKSGIGFMIGLHLSACFGDSPWLEYMDDGPFWQPAGFQVGFEDIVPVDSQGYVHCPETPGLGVVWDMDWLRSIGLYG
ncbi:MAG: mandelate racemase/muconate lactonizing enzyme family protein [Anaerolineae bacterium]|nr:mandelate racemase/muconate lactonizing enzyme family protein [Anaerolineae bacterium]